ncbi:PREDICTED: adenylate kinase 8-like [Amphimedon queenslandica]|uniref:Adenylate kinase n=1 Tax=Amphimedon queenslandica TaxID=400682 RepID=A0A1X7U183_AMPQE|nr:PREDICTED: adenylate kinase 8-like [Amphimedon queenslandica]|eukprot:XP_019856689.1 PREDICTED: adenylate kinase 8-like [Amphimedon queenslandica]
MATGSNTLQIKMEDVTIDATKKLNIPVKYPNYAEKHHIFDLFQHMLQELLLHRPNDPISFLQDLLRRPTDVPGIVIYGPPASGQNTLSKLIARKLRLVHIKPTILLEENENGGSDKQELIEDALPDKLASLIYERLQRADSKAKGWIMEGYPRTREQALALQGRGILVKHFVLLEGPDPVLIERYAGKRVDSVTGDVYHVIFSPPDDPRVAERLVEEKGGVQFHMHSKLEAYHRHSEQMLKCYADVTKRFCCDQPIQDLLVAVSLFLDTRERTMSPHIPRVVLLGPTGSGKSLQAAQLAEKYRIVNVDCSHLLKQVLASGSTLGQQMKPFHDKHMPSTSSNNNNAMNVFSIDDLASTVACTVRDLKKQITPT